MLKKKKKQPKPNNPKNPTLFRGPLAQGQGWERGCCLRIAESSPHPQ